MPLNHPTQLCQDKFTTKDEELRLSIIISCSKIVNNSDNSSTQPQPPHFFYYHEELTLSLSLENINSATYVLEGWPFF